MRTTNPQSDLHQALQSWHAALASNDLDAQIAARLLLDILVAGGLDERIEEITGPASRETGPVLPLLRHANRLTRDLNHLAACQLATARAFERSLAGRGAPSAPSPILPAPNARRRGMIRLDLASLLVLLFLAAYCGFLLGATTLTPKPFPLPLPLPHELPAPRPPAPSGHIPAVLASPTTPAAPAAAVPS